MSDDPQDAAHQIPVPTAKDASPIVAADLDATVDPVTAGSPSDPAAASPAMIDDAVIAVAADRDQAHAALAALHAAAIPVQDIGVVAAAGVAASGHLSADDVPGAQVLAVPVTGPLVVAGILLPALRAAAVDEAIGGLVGALVSLGFPRPRAREFDDLIAGGGVLIAVRAGGAAELAHARDLMVGVGITVVTSRGEAAQEKTSPAPAPLASELLHQQQPIPARLKDRPDEERPEHP
jgi:hypothetical protein